MPCATGTGRCANCACAPSSSSVGASVPLPSRAAASASGNESTPLLWHTTANPASASGYQATHSAAASSSSATDVDVPDDCPIAGSEAEGERICCRQLQTEERTLIDPDLARDCIVGLSDGLTVPFALTAGLSSVGSSRLVVLAGLAELVSGAISMGIGGFLSAQAELSHFHYHQRNTEARVLRSCDTEIDRQVEEILKDYGVEKDTCRRVARELRRKEEERTARAQQAQRLKQSTANTRQRKVFGVLSLPNVHDTTNAASRNNDIESVAEANQEEVDESAGLTPFILRVGSGLEPVSTSRLYISALTIGLSYFIGGAIPLLPYVFIQEASQALFVSIIVTGLILLAFGVVKQRVTGGQGGVKGYLYGAISTLAVGGVAAGASWAIVSLLEKGGE
ncbi:Protein ccc1 [Thecaphora frezii]